MAQAQNPDIAFVVPAEGTFVFVDNWAIPKGARQKELAEDFMNFVRPEISAMIVNHAVRQRQRGRQSFYQAGDSQRPSYAWPEDTKLWWLHDFNDAGQLYERVWLELKGR